MDCIGRGGRGRVTGPFFAAPSSGQSQECTGSTMGRSQRLRTNNSETRNYSRKCTHGYGRNHLLVRCRDDPWHILRVTVKHSLATMMCSLKRKKGWQEEGKSHCVMLFESPQPKLSNFINWRLMGVNVRPPTWWQCWSHYRSMVCIKMYHINKCFFTWANGWHSVTGCILAPVGKVTQWQAWLVHGRCLKKYGNGAKRDLLFLRHTQKKVK